MERSITGYHQDEAGDRVAELPEGLRPGVPHEVQPSGAVRFSVECLVVDRARRVGTGEAGSASPLTDGGDPTCWAGLLCPHCDAVVDGGVHRPGCPAAGATS